ncbi:MAG: metal-sulfur cluster assembly factor [Thermoanaerobaculaceae bacterium]|nr:metal-sulfur cluster assembly factor [Thermoanaerobaculaceae bacterium]MDI9621464.1 metal-sulfur cluster assembly factor [Acidobacteriota bacterium]NLH11112.1 metal-sulfur cluster assembly factor [Holophagae bacterium]HPW54246.1 metal-sulfur cluster assembly factor [Thermoanaerobaculaceae bacterium]
MSEPVLTEEQVREALRVVEDPEIGFSIVDLGLVRDVHIGSDGARVRVLMTLTSPFCPEAPRILEDVRAVVAALPGVAAAAVDLVWSPPWDPRTDASEEIQAELGIW